MSIARPATAAWAALILAAALVAAVLPSLPAGAQTVSYSLELVSLDDGDEQFTDGAYEPAVSADGNEVAFVVDGAPGAIYLRTRTGGTELASPELEAGESATTPRISNDGLRVVFRTTNSGSTGLKFFSAGAADTTDIDGSEGGGAFPAGPDISGDGRWAVFLDDTDPTMTLQRTDLDVNELDVSIQTEIDDCGVSCHVAVDRTGRFIAVTGIRTSVDDPQPGVWVYDATDPMSPVSHQPPGAQRVEAVSMSDNAQHVAYLVHGGGTSTLYRMSVADGTPEPVPLPTGYVPQGPTSLSADGRFLSFVMSCGSCGEGSNVWVHDWSAGSGTALTLASRTTDGQPSEPDDFAPSSAISDDGRVVVFDSNAPGLTIDDGNDAFDADVFAATRSVSQPPTQPLTVSLEDVEVDEQDDGETEVLVTARLNRPAGFDVDIDVEITDGSTSQGDDYTNPPAFAQVGSGTIKVPAGQTTADLAITVLGDEIPEPDETMFVQITSVDPATVQIDQDTATVTITDDDTPTPPTQVPGTTYGDTCVVDPRGPGLVKDVDGLSTADLALGMFECVEPDDVDTVLLGRDDDFADSMASGFLQGEAPMLLVPSSGPLPADVRQRLIDLAPSQVIIVGGTEAIGQDVEDEIRALGIDVVRRSGPTRLETAVDIAATDATGATTAIIARAFPGADGLDPTTAFADSIAAGGMAAELGYPVLLTESDHLSTPTASFLSTSTITDVLVMGGTAAVSDQVVTELQAIVPGTVERVAGDDRFGTAVEVAEKLGATSAADVANLIMVEGQDENAWAAGFTAAYASAQQDAPIVLLNGDDVPPATEAFLSPNDPTFAVDTSPTAGAQPLTCAAQDAACFTARALLGLSGTRVTFDPAPLSDVDDGDVIGIDADPALPPDAELTAAGSCLKDPVADLDDIVIRDDAPQPCTVTLTISYPDGVVQTASTVYGDS